MTPTAHDGDAVEVDGRRVAITNPTKPMYPAAGWAKRDVVAYYRDVGTAMVPHVRERPVSLHRFPDGVDGTHFYEKSCPSWAPPWLETVWVRSTHKDIHHCLLNDRPALVWAANAASLELHAVLATHHDIQRPGRLAFDLDPGPPATLLDAARVAMALRDLLDALGLVSFPKTSGKKGLHVDVPLDGGCTYATTKPFARAIARLLADRDPAQVTDTMTRRARRAGMVFVDWSQNDDVKSTVVAYSLRGTPRPMVSTPVTWDEVEGACRGGDEGALRFDADAVRDRLQRVGDLHAPVLTLAQRLPTVG